MFTKSSKHFLNTSTYAAVCFKHKESRFYFLVSSCKSLTNLSYELAHDLLMLTYLTVNVNGDLTLALLMLSSLFFSKMTRNSAAAPANL